MDGNHVLIVEDNRSLSLALAAVIERMGLHALSAPTLARARECLERTRVQGILLDIGLPDGHGLDLLKDWTWESRPPIAVISAHGEIDNAIAARKLGVSLFLDKPVDFEELQNFLLKLRENDSPTPRNPPTFVGASPAMRTVIRQIAHACASAHPLVIRGDRGTGKSHVAALVAAQSHREAVAPDVIHATSQTSPGEIFELIQEKSRCLIIENVHELPRESQQALARRIDQLGDPLPRLITTTDGCGLREKVHRGDFDSDLYYRLQVLEIHLPPLRERPTDIPALVDSLLGQLDPTGLRQFDLDSLELLQKAPWPGNLRELHNTIKHALVSAGNLPGLSRHHLPEALLTGPGPAPRTTDGLTRELESWVEQALADPSHLPDYKTLLTELETRFLTILLERYQNKPSHLARALRINRATLRKKLRAAPDGEPD